MATELELERTYLLKELPAGLAKADSIIIHDVYIPEHYPHAHLRLRHRGDTYEITKKTPADGNDSSRQYEHTIELEKDEWEALAKASTKDIRKRRYFVTVDGHHAELDVYLDKLEGLVVIDFEFDSDAELQAFKAPSIALAEVTQEETVAAGFLAGKSFADIRPVLEKKYNYKGLQTEK